MLRNKIDFQTYILYYMKLYIYWQQSNYNERIYIMIYDLITQHGGTTIKIRAIERSSITICHLRFLKCCVKR